MRSIKAFVVSMLMLLLAVASAAQAQVRFDPRGYNLLPNPGFEQGTTGWSTDKVLGQSAVQIVNSGSHSGSRCLKVTLSSEGIARFIQKIPVSLDTEYQLSGWVRTENIQSSNGSGVKVAVRGVTQTTLPYSYLQATSSPQTGTNQWTYMVFPFRTGSTNTVTVDCTVGEKGIPDYGTASGSAWFDDLQLVRVASLSRVKVYGAHVILDVYLQDFQFKDAQQLARYYDEIYEGYADLYGAVPYNGQPITYKTDATMSYQYGLLAGNPVVINSVPGWAWWAYLANMSGLDFGGPHEMGHVFDTLANTAAGNFYVTGTDYGNGETWANLKLSFVLEKLSVAHPTLTVPLWDQMMPVGQLGQRFVDLQFQPWSGRQDYWNMPHDAYTGFLYRLRQKVGMEAFKQMFRVYVQAVKLGYLSPADDLTKTRLFCDVLGYCAGQDLTPDFRQLGFPFGQVVYH